MTSKGYVDTAVWNGAVTILDPKYSNATSIVIGGNVENAWQSRAPKSDKLDVVKLTQDNIVGVAKSLLRKFGPTVGVYSGYFTYGTENTGQTFQVGDFIVKDYDYNTETEFPRLATLEERKKYDLR